MIKALLDGYRVYPDFDSFELVQTNLLFSTQGDYTYDLDFSLYVKANKDFFGAFDEVNRIVSQKSGQAELTVDNVVIFKGIYKILSYVNHHVKIQVLAGISEMNNVDVDMSIRDLELGNLKDNGDNPDYINTQVWPYANGCYVPVILGEYGYPNIILGDQEKYIMNCPNFNTGNISLKADKINKLPYLPEIVVRVFEACGWSVNTNFFHTGQWDRMYLVHGFWDENEFAKVLPDWSIVKFINEIRKLMNVEFVFDIINKYVDVIDRREYYRYANTYTIPFQRIVNVRDDLEINMEEVNSTMAYDKFRYNLPDNDWYLHQDTFPNVENICSSDLIYNADDYAYNNFVIFKRYAASLDPLFMKTKQWIRVNSLKGYGDWHTKQDSDGMILDIVPAWIDHRNMFQVYNMELDETFLYSLKFPVAINGNNYFTPIDKNNGAYETITAQKTDEKAYSIMYVAFIGENEMLPFYGSTGSTHTSRYNFYAYSSWVNTYYDENNSLDDWYDWHKFDMKPEVMRDHYYKNTIKLVHNQLYRIKFIGEYGYKVNAIFRFQGRDFMCKELRYKIEKGHMSKVIEGYFVPVDS